MKTDVKLLKNKRLYFVLAILWLIACFLIVRNDAIKTADATLKIDLAYCYEVGNFTTQSCVDDATKFYSALLQITPSQLIDMFALFAAPILLIVVLVSLIKWIANYKY